MVFAATVVIFTVANASFSADLQMFSNARLISNPSNDGDSFRVEIDGKPVNIRLYFVDCAETSVSAPSDARRFREQTRYFGLPNAERTIHFGNQAKKYVDQLLARPFTVHTAFASAQGRSAQGRSYGFITTADADDLASLLVKNGLARTRGIGRETPEGVSRSEMIERLHDLETSAMLKRIGIWSASDPDRIAELRAAQRSEDQELKELQTQVRQAQAPRGLLDLNSATETELQSITGIGPVLAGRIIAGRPYQTVKDLQQVSGIGRVTLEKIHHYFIVGKEKK